MMHSNIFEYFRGFWRYEETLFDTEEIVMWQYLIFCFFSFVAKRIHFKIEWYIFLPISRYSFDIFYERNISKNYWFRRYFNLVLKNKTMCLKSTFSEVTKDIVLSEVSRASLTVLNRRLASSIYSESQLSSRTSFWHRTLQISARNYQKPARESSQTFQTQESSVFITRRYAFPREHHRGRKKKKKKKKKEKKRGGKKRREENHELREYQTLSKLEARANFVPPAPTRHLQHGASKTL